MMKKSKKSRNNNNEDKKKNKKNKKNKNKSVSTRKGKRQAGLEKRIQRKIKTRRERRIQRSLGWDRESEITATADANTRARVRYILYALFRYITCFVDS